MKSILKKIGQNPQGSMSLFIKGVGLFVFGLLLVMLGYYYHHYWQIAGLFVIAIACLISAWAYIGIFLYRITNGINRHKPKR